MARHELNPCAKEVISGTLYQAIEDGREMQKLTVLGLTPHLEVGQVGHRNVAAGMTSVGESPHQLMYKTVSVLLYCSGIWDIVSIMFL